jgi:hypothetical protein
MRFSPHIQNCLSSPPELKVSGAEPKRLNEKKGGLHTG